MQWFNRLLVKVLPFFPKSLIWIFSKRYIAGTTLENAIKESKSLNQNDILVTIDVLGEEISSLEEASAATAECEATLLAIDQSQLEGSLSVKLTQLGLRLDQEKCYQHVRGIVEKAASLNRFVRIDMEDATCTDDTLNIYRRLRQDFDNVGTVVQAYLKRTPADVQSLIDDGIANLRLCKGIYDESPDIAIKDKEGIREQFYQIIGMVLDAKGFAGIATHDPPVVEWSLKYLKEHPVSKENYEFQMLLGVAEHLRRDLVKQGHNMRVYVPYGIQWHGYCMRRLKENPRMAGHIIKNLFIRN